MSADDIEAIYNYFNHTPAVTPEASRLQKAFLSWYHDQNFFTKALDSTFESASQQRTLFNAANNNPENLDTAADISKDRAIAKQAAIASSTVLTPTQKKIALATSPNTPTSPNVPGNASSQPTIKKGSNGKTVQQWQTIIGVAADGKFGPNTEAVTKTWQKNHGLVADGIVGPKSWSAALNVPVQSAPLQPASPPVAFIPPAPAPSSGFKPSTAPAPKAFAPSPVAPAVSKPPSTSSGTNAPSIKALATQTVSAIKLPASFNVKDLLWPSLPAVGGLWFFGPFGAIIGGAGGFLVKKFLIK